jgi:hypothetical protein
MSVRSPRRLDPWLIGLGLGLLSINAVYIAAWLRAPGLGLLSGLVGFVAGLGGPVTAFVVVVVDTVFTSAFRRDLATPVLRPNELALAGVLVGLAFWALRRWLSGGTGRDQLRQLLAPTLIDAGFAAVVVLYTAASLVVHRTDLRIAEVGAALLPVQGWIAYRLALGAMRERRDAARLVALLLGASVVVVAIGVLQLLDVGGTIKLLAQWFDSHHLQTVRRFSRISSVVGTYSGLAAVLGLVIVAAIAAWRRRAASSILPMSLFLMALGVAFLGLLLTGTWAAWVGAAIAILLVLLPLPSGWRSRAAALPGRTRLAAAGAVIGIFVLAAPVIAARLQRQFGDGSLIPESLQTRLDLWNDLFIPAIAQQPMFGVALLIPKDFGWNTAESLYLQWLFQGGIVGTIGWLFLVVTVFVTLFLAVRQTDHWLPRAALAGLVALLVMGFINAFLLLSVSSELFWWLVGGAVGIQRLYAIQRRVQQAA